jgi:hypothetical protein
MNPYSNVVLASLDVIFYMETPLIVYFIFFNPQLDTPYFLRAEISAREILGVVEWEEEYGKGR